MAIYKVDLTNGSNTNDGVLAPFKDFRPINDGGLWNGNEIQVARGSRGIVDAGSRANILAPAGCLLTAYGDPLLPLPVIDAGVVNFNPVWLRGGANITVQQLHVTRAAGSGLVASPIAGQTLVNILLQDILATQCTQNPALWGTDGVQIGGFSVPDAGTVTGVTGRRITGRDNGGHALKVRGRASNVKIYSSTALRSGLRTPAHGMGTAGHIVTLSNSVVGANDIRTGWTNISGNVWEHAASDVGAVTSITSWFAVYLIGAGPTYYKLPFSATPATPGPGECGIGAANTVRINLNGLVAPAALSSLLAVYARPDDVEFHRCTAAYTRDGVTGVEGQGIYFDNGSFKCRSFEGVAFGCDGHGFYLNDATECGHYAPLAWDNGRACVGVVRGDGTNVIGGGLFARAGTRGIEYSTGNQRAKARGNHISGATVGIWSNDSGTNSVTEDENLFVACAQRLQAVSGPGARSQDAATFRAAQGNLRAAKAMQAVLAAELLV